MFKIIKNDIEIEVHDALLAKIREHLKKPSDAHITEDEIIDFFGDAMKSAIDKGYGIVE